MKTTNRLLAWVVCGALAGSSIPAATFYVWQTSPTPATPFSDWATAAHTIQEAVDLAGVGDEVLVLNGVYDRGGRALAGLMTNRVAIDKPILVLSINGPAATRIVGASAPGGGAGDGAIRCAYLGDGATLSGFTLTQGATRTVYDPPTYAESGGGGVWCGSTNAVVSNCVLTANSAAYLGGGAYGGTLYNCAFTDNSAAYGGGASAGLLNGCALTDNSATYFGGGVYYAALNQCGLTNNSATNGGGGAYESTLNACVLNGNSALAEGGGARGGLLNSCVLTGNSAAYYGGGVSGGSLNDCTLTGNSAAYFGGGAYYAALNNCIVYYNTAADGPNHFSSVLNFCCTVPPPDAGVGSITNQPAFRDPAAGDLHLQTNSPCINTGDNSYVLTPGDLDGNPRTVSGTVDIGAYEYQGGGSVISYAWLQQYRLPTSGAKDFEDSDQDGQNNWQEWMADSNPTNAASVLRCTLLSNAPPVAVTIPSSAARLYTLLCSTNLTASLANSGWTPVPGQIDIPGTGAALTFTDTDPPAQVFYRVSVRFP